MRNKAPGRNPLPALTVALALALASLPAGAELSAADVQTYRQAFKAADGGKMEEARQIARRAREDLPDKVLRWIELTRPDTTASWEELTAFMRDNPAWPNQNALRRNAEAKMPDMPYREVRAWFEARPPLTIAGFFRYVDSLMETGASDKAIEQVRRRYVEGGFGRVEEQDFRKRYVGLLRPQDHWARLDRLLWDGDDDGAKRMLPLVEPGKQAVAQARMALAGMAGGAEKALAKVPPQLANDPGLLYERARFRRRKDQDAGALEILAKAPKDMGRAEAWWTERHIIARRLMETGQHARAYQLAAAHGTKDGLSFAQAEFLAGWLALRFLDKPDQALKHFEALSRGTSSPVSKSRGAYWSGRAAEALGDKERAKAFYEAAMSYGSTFYGMLAVDKLGLAPGSSIPKERPLTAEAKKAFERNELARVAKLLARIEGRDSPRLELFVRRMGSEAKTAEEYRQVSAMALELGRQDLAVFNARTALQDGFVILESGYPELDARLNPRPERGLVHAIVRQESTFAPGVVSPAGARGLMQLMPGTAQQVAKGLGLRHTHEKLTSDPDYNVRLGTTYLQELIDRFGGSYVLAIASYNAGSGRVGNWIKEFGDPRASGVDVVDWIETIPIYETRNYVQRVLENLQVYRARLGDPPVSLNTDLNRGAAGNG
ncbi:lytic transglycosylase domain-containing protein [Aerophototrophica crusticola]|uniref:lytic transglycosylase domain-containing protein n=1 Tax=Aerophototrophica crusticola TaxID=1709002 RepID=UPI00384E204E